MAKNIRGHLIPFFMENKGKIVTLDQISKKLNLSTPQIQAAIGNMRRDLLDEFPIEVITRGRAWKYVGVDEQPVEVQNLNTLGRFPANTTFTLVGYVSDGIVLRDPTGDLYRAEKM